MVNPNKNTNSTSSASLELSDEQKNTATLILKPGYIDVLREAIAREGDAKRRDIFENLEYSTVDELEQAIHVAEAEAETFNIEKYLNISGIDQTHPAYDQISEILTCYSPMSMSEAEWQYGRLDSTGKFEPGTSGKEHLKQEVAALLGESPEAGDMPEAELVAMQSELEDARANLAKLSLKLRSRVRKGGKKGKQLQELYDEAEKEYSEALKAIGVHSVDKLVADGLSSEEIIQIVTIGTIAERRAFTEAEAEAMATDNSVMAKLMRRYGKTPVMVGTNMVAGGVIGAVAQKAFKYGFIAALPVAGVAGLAAVRAGKSMLTASLGNRVRLHKEHDKRGIKDINELTQELEQIDPYTDVRYGVNNLAALSSGLVTESVWKRVNRDIRNNKLRVGASVAIAGSSALIGAGIAEWLSSDQTEEVPSGGMDKPKLTGDDKILFDAGVTDPSERAKILANPEAFERMTANPERFAEFIEGVDNIQNETGLTGEALEERVNDTLSLAEHIENSPDIGVGAEMGSAADGFMTGEAASATAETLTISSGGGIIKDVIRPFAEHKSVHLSATQETEIWNSMKSRFGNNIFIGTPVSTNGTDQWIMKPGRARLRPEVAKFLKQRIEQA